ncbi:uncharacterized protein LOC110688776 [Chenopodium quinoa]|uniref:uncharacterized protein LOC110688776 n=1 Tax=Chenopodium quinoa TaxID=63459 RepID=UPI000B776653|nr:uncharacterized protein LOC110688776 [Chenopodium quinoa]
MSDGAVIFPRWGERDRRGRKVRSKRFKKEKGKRQFKPENCPLKRKAISDLELASVQFIEDCEDDADSLLTRRKKKGKGLAHDGPPRCDGLAVLTPFNHLFRNDWTSFELSGGLSGGLWFGWKTKSLFEVVFSCINFLVVKVNDVINGKWRLILVYGEPSTSQRGGVWDCLSQWTNPNLDLPIAIVGDFNQVDSLLDKNGQNSSYIRGANLFIDWKELNDFHDLTFHGPKYTWSNGREGEELVLERLDKGYANSKWLTLFPHSTITHQPIQISDQAPIFFQTHQTTRNKRNSVYKLERWSLNYPECLEVAREIWGKAQRGSSMYKLARKIQFTKKGIKSWTLDKRKEWNGEWDKFDSDLLETQLALEDDGNAEEFIRISKQLGEYSKNMAAYWRQRAKINWNYAGDTCSRFFFNFVKGRKARNKLEAIKDDNSNWITDEDKIAEIANKYFQSLYGLDGQVNDTIRKDEIAQVTRGITAKLTEDQKDLLSKPYSRREIKNTLFAMSPWKAPGPDGVPAGFYQKNWNWIQDDVIEAVQSALYSENKRRTRKGAKGKIAIKTNMRKAYDRIKWDFLEQVLSKFVLPDLMIKTIMNCVSSVSFSVLINGSAQKPFRSRIIGYDQMWRKCREIVGLSVAQKAPKISHLFFADDSAFFIQGKESSVIAFKHILDTYCRASGQVINQGKSTLLASPNSKEEDVNRFSEILEIDKSSNFGVYLGIPADFGTTKNEIFGFMVDRVKVRLNAWNSMFLSHAERLTLIKSVLSSLGTYVLSIFKFPVGILKKIISIIAKFWWLGRKNGKGVYWKSWKRLTTAKEDGGLGILDTRSFNQALLAKQGWRIIMDTDSLISKVFRAKYRIDKASLFNNSWCDRKASFWGWKGIKWGLKVLNKGCSWSIEDGVASLLSDNGEWDMAVCNSMFDGDTVSKIRKIVPMEKGFDDIIIWRGDRSGIYSVRSGYKFIFDSQQQICDTRNKQFPTNQVNWKKFWKTPGSPKHKALLWKICKGALPVGSERKEAWVKIITAFFASKEMQMRRDNWKA